ncbi:hypothetical protein BKA69DRAFT_435726 [Paraphysoderma sedebokerense]|nr:hypothetical protein BKA69DRAFT_435726 [Paraphysoderma sedebokerense]
MAKPGRSLVLVARSADRLNQVRNTCRRLGAKVEIKSLDLKDTTAAQKYFEDVNQRYEVDVIVANAGATSVIDNLEDAPLHDIATNVYKMNVEGTVSTLMPFIEEFKQRRKGHIVVVGSVAGSFSFPNQIIYSSTKAFLNEFTFLLGRHLRQYGIITTLVTPGFVYTRTTALMQEKAGSWFPTFAMVSDTYAAKNIKYGIENNSRWVGFPWVEVVACLAASAIPPRFQSWLTWIGGSTGLGGVKYS